MPASLDISELMSIGEPDIFKATSLYSGVLTPEPMTAPGDADTIKDYFGEQNGRECFNTMCCSDSQLIHLSCGHSCHIQCLAETRVTECPSTCGVPIDPIELMYIHKKWASHIVSQLTKINEHIIALEDTKRSLEDSFDASQSFINFDQLI